MRMYKRVNIYVETKLNQDDREKEMRERENNFRNLEGVLVPYNFFRKKESRKETISCCFRFVVIPYSYQRHENLQGLQVTNLILFFIKHPKPTTITISSYQEI